MLFSPQLYTHGLFLFLYAIHSSETVDRLVHSFLTKAPRETVKHFDRLNSSFALAFEMHSLFAPAVALAAIVAIPAVTAHGYVSGVVSGGKYYPEGGPNWIYQSTKPQQAGWFAYNQDLGFVAPSEYKDENITCHKGATPGTTYIPVKSGSSIDLQWTTWPDSHHGPVISYLAKCQGECTKVDKSTLNFFKIDQQGLIDDSVVPGTWASDKLISESRFSNALYTSG